MSINDQGATAGRATAVTLFMTKLATAAPAAKVISVGIQGTSVPAALRLERNAAIMAAVMAQPNALAWLDPLAEQWITPANAPAYLAGLTGIDNNHLTRLGHAYWDDACTRTHANPDTGCALDLARVGAVPRPAAK